MDAPEFSCPIKIASESGESDDLGTVDLDPPRDMPRTRSVGRELRLLFRAIAVIAVLLLVVNIGSRLYVLAELRPHVKQLHQLQDDLEDLHAGLLNEETGLRGYLATGAAVFLEPYATSKPVVERAGQRLASRVPSGAATRDFMAMQGAAQRWTDEWARLAADPSRAPSLGAAASGRALQPELTEFLAGGLVLFDAYRAAQLKFANTIEQSLADADDTESDWLVWSGVVQAIIAIGGVIMAFVASRRLRRLVAVPVAAIASTVAQLRSGNLTARVPKTQAPTELVVLSRDVDQLAVALQENRDLAQERAQDVVRHSDRLSLVLGVAREVAGSLNVRYVLEAVTTAACRIGSEQVRVWLVDEDDRTICTAYDSDGDRKGPAPEDVLRTEVGVGTVGRAAKYGRPIGPEPAEDGSQTVLAVPMIIGGRVVGVLECLQSVDNPPPGDVLGVLEALAGHAAGSVEAARLHEKTAELAVTDSLTGLPNRRAFDADLAAEVRRALRYGRPLSVIFLDLDEFKKLNDRYGHDYGDIALQQAAAALRTRMRDTDRCYRVGGEELIVIAPETNVRDAVLAAERLRAAVAHSAGPGSPAVTASFGVAELPTHAADGAALVRAADRAVYTAKSRGRNCVVVAGPSGPPKPPGSQGPWVPMPR